MMSEFLLQNHDVKAKGDKSQMKGLCKQGSVLLYSGSKKKCKEVIGKQKKYKSALGKHSASHCISLPLNIPSLARQRCLPSWGPQRTPWFLVISQLFDAVDYSNYVFCGFWNYLSVIQALLASNILCLFISTEVTGGTELLHTHSSLIRHRNNVIFWALSAGHFSNLQRSEPKNNKNNNIPLSYTKRGRGGTPIVFLIFYVFLKEHFISLST